MKKSDFYYELPEALIAQTPLEPRDSSRLLVYDMDTKEVEHKIFRNVIDYLRKGDVLVLNNTRVLPARIYGIKQGTGAKIEFLLLKRIDYDHWEVILKPGKRVDVGTVVTFSDALSAEILEKTESGGRIVRFLFTGVFEDILRKVGSMPLPHYIHEKLENGERYQTVYSKTEGSAAAPTAGLHFTDELLKKIREKGVEVAEALLHVGLGTFRPVKADEIEMHKMHSEYFEITQETCDRINKAKAEGRRVIAVGTTGVRILESASDERGILHPAYGETNIFIYPGYRYKVVDCLITNFHLPESTLIMLVSALIGREETLRIYRLAVEQKYRFFSFGDSMLLKTQQAKRIEDVLQ